MGDRPPLAICEVCRRHVRQSDVNCPFCSAVERVEKPRAILTISGRGLSRSARIAAVAAGVQLAGCDLNPRPMYGASFPPCDNADKCPPVARIGGSGGDGASGSGGLDDLGAGGAAGAESGGAHAGGDAQRTAGHSTVPTDAATDAANDAK